MYTYDGRASVNGHAHAPQQQPQQEWCKMRQCPRCLGRMSGPLAGVVAHRLLPDYDRSNLCTACIYVLAHEPKDAARELARWGTLLAWQQRAMRRQQRRR